MRHHFEARLDKILNENSKFMHMAKSSFIFTPKGELVIGPGKEGHSSIAQDHPEVFGEQLRALNDDGDPDDLLIYLQSECLCGRIGSERKWFRSNEVVWVWSRATKLLSKALQALLAGGYVTTKAIVKVGDGETSVVGRIKEIIAGGGETANVPPEEFLGYVKDDTPQLKSEWERRRQYWPTSEAKGDKHAAMDRST